MISAKVIADSKSPAGSRLTTMVVTFPRIILAEFNTHRMFSRNSASSRAIPFEKMLKSVEENPFTPIAWQKDHKGMQGTEYFLPTEEGYYKANAAWNESRECAICSAKMLSEVGVTKQNCNRLLEPFMWHTVIVTSVEFENFFALRCPKYEDIYVEGKHYRSWKEYIQHIEDTGTRNFANKMSATGRLMQNKGQAEIHMMALAEEMYDAYQESTPNQLETGDWHIPFGESIPSEEILKEFPYANTDWKDHINNIKSKISTAMCARVSYTVVGEGGKKPDYAKDIELHDRLATSGHWSPFEHCAKPRNLMETISQQGNLPGWIQYRKLFHNENLK